MHKGITATLEVLRTARARLNIQDEKLNSKMDNFTFEIIELPTSKWKRLQYMVFRHFGTPRYH
jgi:hypothetical protein